MGMNPRLLRPRQTGFTPRSISGLALWLDAADSSTLYTTDAGPVTAVSSPLDIAGCKLWLDADDASTFTLVSGNVSEWRDKSGSGVPHATQSSSSNRPTRTASGLNGRAVIEFQSAHSLTFASSTASFNFLHNATGATIFFVLKPDTASNPDAIRYLFNNTNNSSSNTGVSIFIDDRSSVSRNNFLFASVNRGVSGQSTSSVGANNFYAAMDAYSITSLTLDNGNATAASRLLLRLNGVQDANVSSLTNAAATGNAALDLTIGNFGGLGAPAGVAEIIFYEGPLSAANRARVEMYLAAKWGISGVHAQATATNDPVGAWLNKASVGGAFTQSASTMRPALTAGYQNGKPAIVSDGVDDWLSASTASIGVASAAAATGVFVTKRPAAGVAAGWDFGTNLSGQQSAGSGLVYDDFFRSVRTPGTFSGQSVSVTSITSPGSGGRGWRINGAQMSFVDSGAFAVPATAYVLGGPTFPSGFTSFGGGMCEALIYTRVLSEAEVAALERYLAAKWGITLAPQVSNADAQDWVNRVYAAGGTVSATTANAVNQFCVDIENSGIRDRFYRVNLFCGNSDGSLAAVRTPLFRGPSLTGTQYGNATDTNVNFGPGDYAETGASGGLKGDGSSKHLDTGFSLASLPSAASRHISAYEIAKSANVDDCSIGGTASSSSDGMVLGTRNPATVYSWARGGPNDVVIASAPYSGGAHWIGQNNTLRAGQLYKNGVLDNSGTSVSDFTSTASNSITVFTWKITGGTPDPAWVFRSTARLGGYSIGTAFTAPQALAYYTAMQAFQAALGRQV